MEIKKRRDIFSYLTQNDYLNKEILSEMNIKNILDMVLIEDPLPILVSTFVQNGKRLQFCVCKNCNHTYTEPEKNILFCPNCKNEQVSTKHNVFSNLHNPSFEFDKEYLGILHFDKESEIAILIKFKMAIQYLNEKIIKEGFDISKIEEYHFEDDIIEKVIATKTLYVWNKKIGLREIYNANIFKCSDSFFFSPAPLINENYRSFIKYLQIEEDPKFLLLQYLYSMEEEKKEIQNNTIKKRQPNKFKDYPFSFFTNSEYVDNIFKEEHIIFNAIEYNTLKNSKEYDVTCFSCGETFKKEFSNDGRQILTKCPCCNRESLYFPFLNTSLVYEYCDIEYWPEEECYVCGTAKLYLNDNQSSIKVTPISQIFMYQDKIIFLKYDNFAIPHEVKKISEYDFSPAKFLNEKGLKDTLEKGFFKYVSALDAWGFENNYEKLKCNPFVYLVCCVLYPGIEQIYKSNLYSIANLILGCRDLSKIKNNFNYDFNKKNICDILKIDKYLFKIIAENNVDNVVVDHLKKIYENEKTITMETYLKIKNFFPQDVSFFSKRIEFNIDKFIMICSQYKISINKLLDYLESCYVNQCIDKSSALEIYEDYLNMCKQMEIEILDSSKKFPNSLKKEHDKVTFSFKIVSTALAVKKFKEKVSGFQYLLYKGTYYQICLPDTPSEVVKEGEKLNHCVASYVKRITEGETIVCFIRETENLDNPFFTVEVKNDEIVQIKGHSNCSPNKNERLMEFIKKWAKQKDLKLKY